jgi:uncharacterized protein with PIN domain
VRFLVDAMLPPDMAVRLREQGHDAVTPTELGAHSLPDDALIELAIANGQVIVTENAIDFAHVTTCTVLFVRKDWWPRTTLADRLAKAISAWAERNPEPGDWPHWLPRELR